jgi:hypothetical protein
VHDTMRICYIPTPPAVLWQYDPRMPNGGHFKGLFLAKIYNLYIEVVSKVSHNLTVHTGSGQKSHHVMDGCLGMLQQNKSDLILSDVPFPTSGHHLIHGPPLMNGRVGMMSTYHFGYRSKFPDLMSFFAGFSPDVWVVVLLLDILIAFSKYITNNVFTREISDIRNAVTDIKFLVRANMAPLAELAIIVRHKHLIRVWKKKVASRRTSSRHKATMTSFVSKQLHRFLLYFDQTDPLEQSSLTIAAFAFFMLAFSFYVKFYFTSLISTSAVVIDQPTTIESYADVLASSMRPTWLSPADQRNEFSAAPIESQARKIWQKASKTGIRKSFVKVPNWNQMINGSVVWLAPEFFLKGLTIKACYLNRDHKIASRYPLVRVDRSAREILFTPMISGFMDRRTGVKVDRSYRRVSEAGFCGMLAFLLHLYYKTTTQEAQTCQSNQVILPDQGDVPAIMLSQCDTLIHTCIILIAACASLVGYQRLFK